MTTIVYDHANGQIAIDSRSTAGCKITSDNTNKYKIKDGWTWFFTGKLADFDQLIELNHNDKPEVTPDCAAIKAKDGKVFLVTFNDGYCSVCDIYYSYSIGSGSDFALAAIDHGKTAKEAIEYAITRDCYTGGKIHVYDVEKEGFLK